MIVPVTVVVCENCGSSVVKDEKEPTLRVGFKCFDPDFVVIEEVDPIFYVGDIKKDIAFGVLFFVENLAGKVLFFCFSKHTRNHILIMLFVVLLESTSGMGYICARVTTLISGAIPSAVFSRE